MMRNGQNKRMRGRNRNNNHSGGHNRGHHHHNPLTRVYESNGPDVKIRGTAHHVAEKYLQLARDATSVGDHVTAEAHYQHAEHYFRLIAAAQEQFRQQNPHYQPPAPQGTDENREGGTDDGFENQPGQNPQQNFQQNYQQNAQPQQQPQPYGGQQQPQQNQPYQQPQHQQRPPQQNQPYQQPQHQPQPQQNQPQVSQPQGDVGGLPSFITGGQPQQPQFSNGNGDNQGDRYRRRRRHRGPHNQQGPDIRTNEGPDDPRPGDE